MENLSLFDEQQTMENLDGVKDSNHLDVVKLKYESCESLTWQDLFSGFDDLYAITYSSGIVFVCKLLDHFEQAEIIFGCEDVMDYSMQSIMAYQCKLIERMRNGAYKKLSDRVGNGTLHLYVARDVLSHEKIYLLSAKDGRKRVVMGSANMSASAFEGRQRENICYMDGDEAFDWYMECYQTLKEKSTDEIGKSSILCADDGEHLDELPIAKTVRVKKAVVIQPVSEEMSPSWLKQNYGKQIVFHGGIDTQELLNFGSAAQIDESVHQTVEILDRDGGYIFAAAHNIQDDVPPENIVTMFHAARKYGRKQ